MAAKKGNQLLVRIKSTESHYLYYTQKNRKNDHVPLALRTFDPALRRRVLYRETT